MQNAWPLLLAQQPHRDLVARALEVDLVDDIGTVTPDSVFPNNWFTTHADGTVVTYPMMALGAHGTMNAVANLVPDRIAALCNAILAGDMMESRRLHFDLYGLNQSIFFDTNPIPLKNMMKRIGIVDRNEHRLPMLAATPELEKRLDEVLKRAGLL